MRKIDLTIIVALHRPYHVMEQIASFSKNDCNIEIIFVGKEIPEEAKNIGNVRYFVTEDGAAKRYARAYHMAKGEFIHLTADDYVYNYGAFDAILATYRQLNNKKAIVICRNFEELQRGSDNVQHFKEITYQHNLYGIKNTPLMAFAPTISKEYYIELGGIDKRFYGGEFENDLFLRVMQDHGQLIVCNDSIIYGAHWRKHGKNEDTLKKTTTLGIELMMRLWTDDGTMDTFSINRRDEVQRYLDEDFSCSTDINKEQ